MRTILRRGNGAHECAPYGSLQVIPDDAFAFFFQAASQCILGESGASVDDWIRAFRIDGGFAKMFYGDLRARGVYDGYFHPKYGMASKKDLREWVADGCP